jgi:two-component system chemotaxis response regulator CheY
MRILLIDDSKTARTIQRAVLEQLGYSDFEEACDGQDALARLTIYKPDLILVDWSMPVMDGIEFVREFRATNKATPIIMVTNESERSRVIEAIRAGVNTYLVKPFTPELLAMRIQETVTRAQAA